MTKASIIIPTLNRKEILLETLKHLSTLQGDFEVLVVDQSDEPILEKALKDIDQRIRLVRVEEKGLPNARNLGAEEADGEILIYLDDDVLIQNQDFLEAHVHNFQNPLVGAVAGRVKQPGEGVSIKVIGGIRTALLVVGGSFNYIEKQKVTGMIGCNFSIRKSLVRELGGFDKGFIGSANLEESDMAIRVQRAGYEIVFEPQAYLHHLAWQKGGVRNDLKKNFEKYKWIARNQKYFFKKHGSPILFPLFICVVIVRGKLYSFKEKSLKPLIETFKGVLISFNFS
ncbi:glycosyltransferase [Candidatus Parcubacteria bacterium]|nr:glycosyltransferase [Candidatus Parcubacteria bacterium]